METNLIETVNGLIEGMDIPIGRKDVSKPETTRWLLRNLGVRNTKHEKYEEARKALVQLARIQNVACQKELRQLEAQLQ